MKTIQLTQNQVAIVDDIDADLAALNWLPQKKEQTFYVVRHVRKPDGRRTTEALHQVIAQRMGIDGAPDHVDRSGLNNRRDNLRPATSSQQGANRRRPSNNKSGFRGVSQRKRDGKWQAQIKVAGKSRHLGTFDDPSAAAHAYDRAAVQHFGPFAFLNFPTQPANDNGPYTQPTPRSPATSA